MAETVRGDVVSLAEGSFQLRCTVSYTASAIKFKPYVVVSTGFKQAYNCTVSFSVPPATKGGLIVEGKTTPTTLSFTRALQSAGAYYIPESAKWQANRDYSVTVRARMGGKTSTCVITSNVKPPAPSIKVARKNDNHYSLTIKGKAKGATIPTNTVTIQRQADIATASWSAVATRSPATTNGYDYTVQDQTTDRGHRYRWRVRATNQAGNSGWVVSDWRYTNPPALANVAHERLSNTQNRVTWTWDIEALDRQLITGVVIQRQTNGGSWVTAAKKTASQTTPAGSGNAEQGVWTDTGRSVDKSYRYRIKPYNPSISASLYESPSADGTAVTYNTPAAPASVKAVYTSAGNITLTIKTATQTTATGLVIQRSNDGGSTWATVATLSTVETTWTDTSVPTGGTLVYRVAATRSTLPAGEQASPYKQSNTVTALSRPNPPTLILPADGAVYTFADSTARLVWVHNPTDGTEMENAIVQYRVTGGTWESVTVTDSYYDLPLDDFSPNDTIEWRVSTKGAYATRSAYSDASTIVVYAAPAITVTSPANGETITNLPIEFSMDYADESGTLAQLTLSVMQGNDVLYVEDVPVDSGEPGTYSYSLAGFIFENESDYSIVATAQSSTGLIASDSIGITVSYVPVTLSGGLLPDVMLDSDTGYATITLSVDESPSGTPDPDVEEPIVVDSPVADAYLYRVVNGERTLLGSGLAEGDQITDRYAPLNAQFTYELLMVAESGQISLVQVDEYLASLYFFAYFGDDMARALWNPEGNVELSRPERTQIRYSGRVYPVTYDSVAMGQTFGLSFAITDRAELDAFTRLMQTGGQGVFKSADGDVYAADFAFSYSATYSNNRLAWQASLDVTRIDSEDL